MVVGTISRTSVRRSLKNDVSALQIINFMKTYAHPRMSTEHLIIPENVTDQLYLWEAETTAIKPQPAMILSEFTKAEYEDVLKFAADNNCLLWPVPGSGTVEWKEGSARLVVTEAAFREKVGPYLKARGNKR